MPIRSPRLSTRLAVFATPWAVAQPHRFWRTENFVVLVFGPQGAMAFAWDAFITHNFLPDYARMLAAAYLFDYVLTDPYALLPIGPDPRAWAIAVAYAATYLACQAASIAFPAAPVHSPHCQKLGNSVVAAVVGKHIGVGYGISAFATVSILPRSWQWFGKRRDIAPQSGLPRRKLPRSSQSAGGSQGQHAGAQAAACAEFGNTLRRASPRQTTVAWLRQCGHATAISTIQNMEEKLGCKIPVTLSIEYHLNLQYSFLHVSRLLVTKMAKSMLLKNDASPQIHTVTMCIDV